jgi:hypothetical protein
VLHISNERESDDDIIENSEDELLQGICPPRTGSREKYRKHEVVSDVVLEYRRHNPLRAGGDMNGLPLPVLPGT